MGEVYRAYDTRLERNVAIKVLPQHLSSHPDALARFEREAKAIAALPHPNILAIHDFGREGGVTYAVTELLEGETLREKLADSGLPVRKAVDYALQIVHGIAAAHQKGIVHRDLKPENIFITQDGRVKILDFGLAKAAEAAVDGSLAPTRNATATSPGTVMGTVGYMSPEQVRGQSTDHRTDIFSFGVVLYEMLSGLRPFRRDSNVETMNAILKEDPPDFTASGVHVPAALDRIVRRCIEKNVDERFHSAHDLGLALEALSGSGSSGSSPASTAALPRDARRSAKPWLLAAGAVAIAVLAFFAGQLASRPAPTETAAYQRLTFRRGSISSARYAGDGKTAVYSATWQDEPKRLYTTRQESPDSLTLAFPDADVTSVSKTGELALVLKRRTLRGYARVGTLARASLSGGAARDVLEDVQDADWLPDGSGFAVARFVDGRYHLEMPVGRTLYETGGWVSDVRIAPDGALVAFADHPVWGDDRGALAVIDGSGKKRTLSGDYSSIQGVAWAKQGREIWFTASDKGSARALFAVTPEGALRTVTQAPTSLHLGDIGADGSVLLWQENSRTGLIGRVDGDAKVRDLSWFDWSTIPRLSRDGRTLIFTEEGDGGGSEYSIYMRSVDGSPAVRLGSGVGVDLSPDGKWVLALRLNPAPAQFVLLPTGAGEVKVLTNDTLAHGLGRFNADGTRIYFEGIEPGRQPRIFVQDISGGPAKPVTPEGVTGFASPDGSLVASADGKLYPTSGGAPRAIPGFEAKDRIEGWDPGSASIFVRSDLSSGNANVFRLDGDGRRTLIHAVDAVPGASLGIWLGITPDGSTCVITYTIVETDLFRVTGLK